MLIINKVTLCPPTQITACTKIFYRRESKNVGVVVSYVRKLTAKELLKVRREGMNNP